MEKRAIIFLLSLLKATMLYDSYSSFASKPLQGVLLIGAFGPSART